jgi:predicted signal transduction protein with EAL and GGDEF domain
MSVMRVDIDHFESINDTYDHPAGNEVIKQATVRISGVLRTYDAVGCFGDDATRFRPLSLLEGLDAGADDYLNKLPATCAAGQGESVGSVAIICSAFLPSLE